MDRIVRKNNKNRLTELYLDRSLDEYCFDSVSEFVTAVEVDAGASVECVRMEGNFLGGLSPATMKGLLNAIGRLPRLQQVRLCGVGGLRVDHLAELVDNARKLTLLDVQQVSLEGNQEDFSKLEVALYKHAHLEQFVLLDFSIREATEVSFDRVVQVLGLIRTIRVVELERDNNAEQQQRSPDTKHELRLPRSLLRSKTLEELRVSGFSLDRSCVERVAKALLKSNSTRCCSALKTLSLRRAGLDDDCAIKLANALKQHPCLEVLDLSDNEITGDGCVALADCLQSNKTVRAIGVDGNESVEPAMVATMGAMLRRSKRGGRMQQQLQASSNHKHAVAA